MEFLSDVFLLALPCCDERCECFVGCDSVCGAECSDDFSDDNRFSYCLFCVVVRGFHIFVFDAGEPALDVEVDVFGDCFAVAISCIISCDFLESRSHVFVFFLPFLRRSFFAVEDFDLLKEGDELIVEMFSGDIHFELCAFAQKVRPAPLQRSACEVVVCSPTVAMHDSVVAFSKNFF